MSTKPKDHTQQTVHNSYLHGTHLSPHDRIEKPTVTQALERKAKKSTKNYNVTKYSSAALTTAVGIGMLGAGWAIDSATFGAFSTALLTTGAITTAAGLGGAGFRHVFDKFITKTRAGKFLQVSNGLQAFLVGLGAILTGLGFTVAPEILPFVPIVFGLNYAAGQLNESSYFNKKLEYDKRSKSIDSATKDIMSRLNPVQQQTFKSLNIANKKHHTAKVVAGLIESSSLTSSTILSTSTRFFKDISMPGSPISSALGGVGTGFGIAHDQLMKKGAKVNLLRAQQDFEFVNRIAYGHRDNIISGIISDIAQSLSPHGFNTKSHNQNVLFYAKKALLESGLSTETLFNNKQIVKNTVLQILNPLMGEKESFDRHALRDIGASLALDGRKTSILDAMPLLEREISTRVAAAVDKKFYQKASKISSEIIREFDINIETSEDKKLFSFALQNIVLKAFSQSQGKVDEKALKELIGNELPKYLERGYYDDRTIPSKGKLRDEFASEDKENATNEALINKAANSIWDKVEAILPKISKEEEIKKAGCRVREVSRLSQQFKEHSAAPAA